MPPHTCTMNNEDKCIPYEHGSCIVFLYKDLLHILKTTACYTAGCNNPKNMKSLSAAIRWSHKCVLFLRMAFLTLDFHSDLEGIALRWQKVINNVMQFIFLQNLTNIRYESQCNTRSTWIVNTKTIKISLDTKPDNRDISLCKNVR